MARLQGKNKIPLPISQLRVSTSLASPPSPSGSPDLLSGQVDAVNVDDEFHEARRHDHGEQIEGGRKFEEGNDEGEKRGKDNTDENIGDKNNDDENADDEMDEDRTVLWANVPTAPSPAPIGSTLPSPMQVDAIEGGVDDEEGEERNDDDVNYGNENNSDDMDEDQMVLSVQSQI
jgi:hypothetical protein